MGCEVNAELIRALEKRIEEGKGDIIKLKRARNSLLNIFVRVPPEILGHIFVWSLGRARNHTLCSDLHFDRPPKGPYNFLLVCHHWFEVASCTPELWNFWGNTLQDWAKQYRHSGAIPLDLVLDGYSARHPGVVLDGPLRDALRECVTQDKIRQIHIRGHHDNLDLASILSSLIPDGEGIQEKRIESIIFQLAVKETTTELSKFFARVHLPKLRYLDISGNLQISSWDHLTSQTTCLTALSLQLILPSPALTTCQLFSLLALNPNLRELTLHRAAIPDDIDGPVFRLPLHHLESIFLVGELRLVLRLLHRLELPAALDSMTLEVNSSTIEDVLQTLGPYMRDHFRRDIRFQGRLWITTSSLYGHVGISVSPAGDRLDQIHWPEQKPPLAEFVVYPTGPLPDPIMEELLLDWMAFTPREHVVCFKAEDRGKIPELFVAMPNIEMLWLCDAIFSEGFLQPAPGGPHANTKLLPSLRSLKLEDVVLEDGNWDHLTTYLAHQTSDDQVLSLQVTGDIPLIPPEVADEIRGLVEEFVYYPIPFVYSRCDCGCDRLDEDNEEGEHGDYEDHEEG